MVAFQDQVFPGLDVKEEKGQEEGEDQQGCRFGFVFVKLSIPVKSIQGMYG